MRVLTAAVVWSIVLLAASPSPRAAELPPVWKDGWTINTPGRSTWVSGGSNSFYAPGETAPFALGASKDNHGFADFSVGRTLGIGRDLGFDNMQVTLGARVSEPLVANGFTPAFDSRRYLGVGPRLGLEGNKTLDSSWVVEWQVGGALLSGGRTVDAGVVNSPLPNFANSGSVLNVDGLLGLSYWFDRASKLTVGYHADYFKPSSPTLNLSGAAADSAARVDHGPMVRFSIQK